MTNLGPWPIPRNTIKHPELKSLFLCFDLIPHHLSENSKDSY